MTADTATEVFESHRPVLTGVAYRMLGRIADAEDVVQEAWLRWSSASREDVREPRAFLVRITTRLAIDRLRQVQSRREAYVGPWLPEPVVTEFGPSVPDSAEQAVLADSVSVAVLVVLESLSPLERAVFVLREAFGFPHAEIAAALDRTEAAVRQLAGRARRHVEERKPRYDVDPARRRDLTERFLAAATGGDIEELLALLAPDARLVGDSGGKSRRRCGSSRVPTRSAASSSPSPTTRSRNSTSGCSNSTADRGCCCSWVEKSTRSFSSTSRTGSSSAYISCATLTSSPASPISGRSSRSLIAGPCTARVRSPTSARPWGFLLRSPHGVTNVL